MAPITSVVLVHGAWANSSSWNKIIPILKAHGLTVSAVHLTLSSFPLDVAATNRLINAQEGQVLLVGHSYGGAVNTEAGNNPKVEGLVYIAAPAPVEGEGATTRNGNYPPAAAFAEFRDIGDGYIRLTEEGIKQYFAQDLSPDEKELMVINQGITNGEVFGAPVTVAAWKTKPSWYVVAGNDKTIQPEQQRDTAKEINAKTLEVSASHVPMLAQPEKVAEFILDAVKSLNG